MNIKEMLQAELQEIGWKLIKYPNQEKYKLADDSENLTGWIFDNNGVYKMLFKQDVMNNSSFTMRVKKDSIKEATRDYVQITDGNGTSIVFKRLN